MTRKTPTVVVSGARRGIGRATADRLHRAGAVVYALDVDLAGVRVRDEDRLSWHEVDVTDENQGGVETLTRVAASQLAAQGIRVNTVVPGAIATRMTPDPAAGRECALGRRGQAAEVAAAIVFLLSGDASYITGAALPVDGGFGLR